MAKQDAITTVGKIVDRFLFKYKLSKEDYAIYREHAYDLVRTINMFHNNYAQEIELTITSPGYISMPVDLIDPVYVYYTADKDMWPLTRRDDLVITGENAIGETKNYGMGYGTAGGRNIGYWRADWDNRLIYIDGLDVGEKVILSYISTGISTDAETLVPIEQEEVFDTYLRLQQGKIERMPYTEQKLRQDDFDNALNKYRRLHIGSIGELKDAIMSHYGQAPKR